MKKSDQHNGLNIVLRGVFNPSTFQPLWMASQGLIRESEGEKAEIKIINPTVTEFSLDWVQIQVTQDRFQARTDKEAYFEPLRDLVVSIFSLFSQTPLRGLGVNRDVIFHYDTEDEWNRLGNKIAPKEIWGETLHKPGTLALVLKEERNDEYKGYVQVSVRSHGNKGVYIEVNDHYILHPEENDYSPSIDTQLVSILSTKWNDSLEHALDIRNLVYSFGKKHNDN